MQKSSDSSAELNFPNREVLPLVGNKESNTCPYHQTPCLELKALWKVSYLFFSGLSKWNPLQKMFIEHLPGLRNYGRHSRIYTEKYLFERSIKLIIESKFINRVQGLSSKVTVWICCAPFFCVAHVKHRCTNQLGDQG